MTTFNTGNPVGSSDPRDLYDNAENADNLINGDQAAYNDRTGVSRKSWAGVEQQVAQQATEFAADQASRETTFANFLNSSGFEYLGEYAAGITFTEYNQYVVSAGEAWFISPSTALPYTTTGAGLPEGGALMSRGEAVLRQEIGSGIRRVDSLAGLQAISGRFAGDVAYMVGRTTAGDGGEGEFRWDASDLSASVTSDPQQGVYVAPSSAPTGASGAWVRHFKGDVFPEWFGAKADGTTDDGSAFVAALNFGSHRVSLDSQKEYLMSSRALPDIGAEEFYINGNGAKIILAGGSSAADIFQVRLSQSLFLKNIVFDGNGSNQVAENNLIGSTGGAARLLDIDDCKFINSSGGAVVGSFTNFRTQNSEYVDLPDYPVQATGTGRFIATENVVNCDASVTTVSSTVRAFQPTNYTSVIVSGNRLDSSRKYRDGVWLNACSNVSVTGNAISEFVDDSVTLVGACENVTVSGNSLRGSDVTGGVVTTAGSTVTNLSVTGNVFNDGIRGVYLFAVNGATIQGNVFDSYDSGIVLVTAEPSTDITISGNFFSSVVNNHVDLGASDDILISANQFTALSGASSISILGSTATNVTVSGNEFNGLAFRAVQTGNSNWSVSGNLFDQVPDRCISVGDSAGTVGLTVDHNRFNLCDSPLAVVSAKGTTKIAANGNVADSQTDQKASGSPAFSFGDATRFVMTGNIFTNYRRGADSAAGSNLGVFVGNDESGCGATTTLGSATTKSVANNI